MSFKIGLNLGQLSVRIKKAQINDAAGSMAGKTGFFQMRKRGIYLQGKQIVSDQQLSCALIERNLRNLLIPEAQSKTLLTKILSEVISQPQEAEKSLSSIGAIFNLPENVVDKAVSFTVIKPQEGALFLAEEGEVYKLEQIINGEVPGLGEEAIEFMEAHGLDRLVFAKGKIVAPYLEIGLGGQIKNTEEGMSKQMTVNWATAVARLDAEKCTGCSQCIVFCPEESIHINGEKEINGRKRPKIEIDLTNCKGCGLCAGTCPTNISAITMIGKDTPEGVELLKEVFGKG